MFRLIIAAGKDFTDYQLFSERLDYYLQSKTDVELLTGFCKSSDQLAELYAAAKGHTVKPFPPGFKGITPMMAYADAAVVFYDGHTSGCGKLIRECTVPVKVVKYSSQKPDKPPAQPKSPKPKTDNSWKERYQQAHEKWFAQEYPATYKDGHYCQPKYYDVNTSGGLTNVIINFATWEGHYGNRINVMGRKIGGITTTESGAKFDDTRWIKSSTKKGTEDIDMILFTRPIKIEIKIGRDSQKHKQREQQRKVERAGGRYFIIKTIDEWFALYDRLASEVRGEQGALF